MKTCPECGRELSSAESFCPACKKRVQPPFTILKFLWDNFRFFTMIGITGTMISLIPNMGNRILGTSWITDQESFLPLFLSVIIFFGAMFLTVCFLMIFSLIFKDRDTGNVVKKITLFSKTLTWYEGDSQRFILLFILVPMWVGLLLFFVLLMPLVPNRYSWMFAALVGLTCIPLFLYSLLGWKIGRTVIGKIPGLEHHPWLGMALFIIVLSGSIVLLSVAIPQTLANKDTFSGEVNIRADQQYFSPGISSAKGLRLEITNVSGPTLQASRRTWSATYGYFIRVLPSTDEVTIIGNPAHDDTSRFIYWTFSDNNFGQEKKPVRIDVQLYSLGGDEEIARSSLYLTWYTGDVVYVNTSSGSPM